MALTLLQRALTGEHVAHAYLFSGREGVGKKLLAQQFAQSLNCEKGVSFSECSCESCRKIREDIHPDVKWIGLDEELRSIKIEDIRLLQSWVALRPFEGRKKVVIINGAERLTIEAANAFLKTLEEPPGNTHIVLLIEHVFRLPDTVLSRLVEIRLLPLPFERLCTILNSEFHITEGTRYLAYQAQGSIGLALHYKEEDFLTIRNTVIDSFLKQDLIEYFFSSMPTAVSEIDTFLYIIGSVVHDMLLIKTGVDHSLLIHQDRTADVVSRAELLTREQIVQLITLFEDARQSLKQNVNTKLLLLHLAAHGDLILKKINNQKQTANALRYAM